MVAQDFQYQINKYSKKIEANPDDFDSYLKRGNVYRSCSEYNLAVEDYSTVINLNRGIEEAYYCRALCFEQLEKIFDAQMDYEVAITINPSRASSYFNLAKIHDDHDTYDKAVVFYSDYICLEPGDAYSYYRRAMAYDELGGYEEALSDLVKMVELDSGNELANAKIEEIKSYITDTIQSHANKYPCPVCDSIHSWEQNDKGFEIISVCPEFHSKLPGIIKLQYEQQEEDDDVLDLTEDEEMTAADSKLLSDYISWRIDDMEEKGVEYDDEFNPIGDYDEEELLEVDYRSFLQSGKLICPGCLDEKPKVLFYPRKYDEGVYVCAACMINIIKGNRLFELANQEEDLELSIKYYDEAINIDPRRSNLFSTYLGRAWVYKELKEYKKAIADYTQIINAKPYPLTEIIKNAHRSDKISAYKGRAQSYLAIKEYQNVVDDLSHIIDIDIDEARNYIRDGLLYCGIEKNQERYKKASQEGDYITAFRLQSWSYSESCYLRGFSYRMLKHHMKAIDDYSRYIEFNSTEPMGYFNRGLCYGSIKDYENSISDFTQAIQLKPDNPECFYYRGLSYKFLNQKDNAISDMEKAINLNPDYIQAIKEKDELLK